MFITVERFRVSVYGGLAYDIYWTAYLKRRVTSCGRLGFF